MKTLDSLAVRSDGPTWLSRHRRDAFDCFEKLAMPSSTEEMWRYVDLDFDIADYRLVDEPGEPSSAAADLASILGPVAGSALVVDGVTTRVATDAPGVRFAAIADIVESEPEVLETGSGQGIPADLDKFAAAHHAFGTDGVVLTVPAGTAVAAPFFIDVRAATTGAVSFPRIVVVVERSAEASVVIRYESTDDVAALVVPHLEAQIGDNARLKLTIVQHWGRGVDSVAHARVLVGADGRIHLGEAGLGGKLARLQLQIDLVGRGSSADVVGAYFGDGDQTLDYRYTMHHRGTNTSSDMLLKGAVQDEALSVFTGMIRIDESAQKTDAFQTNRNLILSDGASAESMPKLEILANDVRCGHGSTMGPLDDEQRYYLMSRGLDGPRTDRLLVHGFFTQALVRFPEASVADLVTSWIDEGYRAAQAAGRV